ncbi:Endonuclease/exonuclease/phosphatase [Gaertneriomyces semiglobifer]|nr:Endonuclease/exonuclease/phosphatase [Gaertneriomyces semiglobifer]
MVELDSDGSAIAADIESGEALIGVLRLDYAPPLPPSPEAALHQDFRLAALSYWPDSPLLAHAHVQSPSAPLPDEPHDLHVRRYRIFSWNVNSIRNLVRTGTHLADLFDEHRVDIACFQEVKLQTSNLTPTLTEVPGYVSFWSLPVAHQKGVKGVATYVRTNLFPDLTNLRVITAFPEFDVHPDASGRILILDSPELCVINAYYPNAGMHPAPRADALTLKRDLHECIARHIANADKEQLIFFAGDLNVAHT